MAEQQNGWRNVMLNAALVAAVVVVGMLLYALVRGPLLPNVTDGPEAAVGSDIIQVEVRNGAGVADLAARTRNYLVRHDIDVVAVSDHESFDVPRSRVVDRVGDMEAARQVAGLLGIPPERVEQDVRSDYYLDVSIIIGRDYVTLRPFSTE